MCSVNAATLRQQLHGDLCVLFSSCASLTPPGVINTRGIAGPGLISCLCDLVSLSLAQALVFFFT